MTEDEKAALAKKNAYVAKSFVESELEAFDRKPAEEVDSFTLDFDNIMDQCGMGKFIDDLELDSGSDGFDSDEEESKADLEEMRKKAKRWLNLVVVYIHV